jgi:hypothetical protein
MIELATTQQPTSKAMTKADQIRKYIAENPKATPVEISQAMGVNRQYIYTVMWETKRKAKGKTGKAVKKLGRPRKVTEASANLNKLVDEYRAKKAEGKAEFKNLGVYSSKQPLQNVLRINLVEPKSDPVNHPAHYKVGGIETIDFIEAKKLNYNTGNVVKYITRADHKGSRLQDLRKAQWYLEREIWNVENNKKTS